MTENPKPEFEHGEKSVDQVLKEQYHKRLTDAITDAQYLLMYASTTCPSDINRGTLETLIDARRRIESSQTFTARQEADFWLAYQDIWN
ncbi:MAG: hypothetical protein HC797_00290 [Anaerolineales bacterium]|nr:hypothetical protein [Anaerolineales bacterium]